MSLKKKSTKWALFLSASGDPEPRHILDLAFGLQCLEAASIDKANIFLYIDGIDRAIIDTLISVGSKNKYTIKTSADFFKELASNTHENLVMFVTGHGSLTGIDAPTPIKPHALIRAIKGAPNLKQAVIYLGSCYAGIFNYIGAGKKPDKDKEPDVILIGATNLNLSLSSETKETFHVGEIPWLANLFLLYVFKWISAPQDVDGDGLFTVIDSYKYAGVSASDSTKKAKAGLFSELIYLHGHWHDAKNVHAAGPTQQTQLALDAVLNQYNNKLSLHHVHQECWILNAIPAQSIEF